MMNARAVYTLFFPLFLYNFIYSQQDTTERCPVVKERFYYDSGHLMITSLEVDSTYKGYFKNGNGIGFRFLKDYDCPNVFDEQYHDYFEWSVETGIDSFFFSFSHNQQPPPNFHYMRLQGQRGNPSYHLVSIGGYVKGIRQGNKWLIIADVEITSKHNYASLFQKRNFVFSKVFEVVKKKSKNLAF